MAAVSPRMEGTSLNDSIFSLLDHSWYSQSILKHSIASGVPDLSSSTSAGVDSEIVLRSSEVDSASGTSSSSTDCSALQSVDDYSHRGTGENNESEFRRCSNSAECSALQSADDYSNQSTSENIGSKFRRCSVDKSEMRRVFDRFDSNGDGLISKDELHRYMKCCGTVVSDAEANSMISCVDLNNDGSVDFEEFLLLYQTHFSGDATGEDDERSREDEEQDLLEAFRVFDSNNDGFISAQELQAVLLNLGMLEGKSLINCEAMINIVDRDGDGQCDIREFQEMMAAHPF